MKTDNTQTLLHVYNTLKQHTLFVGCFVVCGTIFASSVGIAISSGNSSQKLLAQTDSYIHGDNTLAVLSDNQKKQDQDIEVVATERDSHSVYNSDGRDLAMQEASISWQSHNTNTAAGTRKTVTVDNTDIATDNQLSDGESSAHQEEYHTDFEDGEDHNHEGVTYSYIPERIIPPAPLNRVVEASPIAITSELKGFTSVSGITAGQTNVSTTQPFTVQFSTPPSQTLLKSLRFYPEAAFTTSFAANSNQLTVYPVRLARNTDYVFGLQIMQYCSFGSDSVCTGADTPLGYAFSTHFRTDWKEKYTYGISFQGRPLDAYVFGFGDKTGKVIMLTGGIHGSEWRSGDLTQLKDYLWTRPEELIGQNKTIIIIPFMNPDGTTMNIRHNARGVNLNRNFPAYWVPCANCGPTAYSESESAQWGQFAQAEGTTHLISYHAQWPPHGIIFKGADGVAAIDDFAVWVSNRTGYPLGDFPGDSQTPSDIVPGDQTVWAATWGVTSIIIEATYIPNSDWNKNFPMYLDLLRSY